MSNMNKMEYCNVSYETKEHNEDVSFDDICNEYPITNLSYHVSQITRPFIFIKDTELLKEKITRLKQLIHSLKFTTEIKSLACPECGYNTFIKDFSIESLNKIGKDILIDVKYIINKKFIDILDKKFNINMLSLDQKPLTDDRILLKIYGSCKKCKHSIRFQLIPIIYLYFNKTIYFDKSFETNVKMWNEFIEILKYVPSIEYFID